MTAQIDLSRFSFPVRVERDGNFLVLSFRDIPEALGQITVADKHILHDEAREALMIAIRYYIKDMRIIPEASEPEEGEEAINLPIDFCASIVMHNALIRDGVYSPELARLLSIYA